MIERGRALQARREAMGLSREALSEATRIPVAHVAALEEGRIGDLPAGPYAGAWMRALENHVGIDGSGAATPAPAPTRTPQAASGTPLWLVRGAAFAAVVVLAGAMIWQALKVEGIEPPVLAPSEDAGARVHLKATKNVRVVVAIDDGEPVVKQLKGGDELDLNGAERVALEVQAADAVRLEFNGERVVPQGRQDEPRRLVFVDDVYGGDR